MSSGRTDLVLFDLRADSTYLSIDFVRKLKLRGPSECTSFLALRNKGSQRSKTCNVYDLDLINKQIHFILIIEVMSIYLPLRCQSVPDDMMQPFSHL